MITALLLPAGLASSYPSFSRIGIGNTRPEIDTTVSAHLARIANSHRGTPVARPDPGHKPLPWLDGNHRLPRDTILRMLESMHAAFSDDQVHFKRLDALRTLIDAMSARGADEPLDRKECKALAALMRKIGKSSFDRDGFHGRSQLLRDLCRALRAVSKASAIQWKLEQEIARQEEKYRMFQQSGAYRSKGAAISAGGVFGVPFAMSARLGGALGRTKLVSTDDILNVQDIYQSSIKAQAKIAMGTDIELGIDAQASVEYTRGPLYEWGDANEHAAARAMARVNRVRGLKQLINGLKPLSQALGVKVKPALGRYDAIMQRADRHRDTLPMLASALGIHLQPTTWKAPSHPTLKPVKATLTTIKATGQLNASWLAASTGVGAVASRTCISVPIKTDFSRYLDGGPPTSELDRQRADVLAKRGHRLWSADEANSPQYRLLTEEGRGQLAGWTLEERLAYFEAEIDQYEHLARYNDLNPGSPSAASAETSFASSWLAASREDVLIHMLDAHAYLKARAIRSGDMQSVPLLKETFARTASRLYNMRIRHDSERVYEATSVTDCLTQYMRHKTISLNVGAGLDLCRNGVSASLAHIHRDDPNPLREGQYIDIELAFSAAASPDVLLEPLLDSLQGNIDDSMFADVSSYLGTHSSDIGAGVRIQIRFYRPGYQSDPHFPEKARGYHFQTARFYRDRGGSLGAQVPVPLFGGVAADLGVHIHRNSSAQVREHFGNNTLTGPMLRYMRLRDAPDADARWGAFCEGQKSSLAGLMDALGDPASDVAKEAAYWSERRADAKDRHPIFAQMKTFRQGLSHYSTALKQLGVFFGDLQEPFNALKRDSPWLVPVPLA